MSHSLGAAFVCAATVLLLAAPAGAVVGSPPRSMQQQVKSLAEVKQAILFPTDVAKELAVEKAKEAHTPLRYAVGQQVSLTPATDGTWEQLPDGRLWRVRILSSGATDLNLAFTTFWLPGGATLHVLAESEDYYQGPYTAKDNSEQGQLWTPVVPGEAAVVEVFVPAGAKEEPRLVLGQVGAGFLDLFHRQKSLSIPKAEACEVDVVCPLGLPWTNQIRSVARYSIAGMYLCSGTLIADAAGDFRNYFLTANHCVGSASDAASVVVYWNFQSSRCGEHGGGSLADNQSGASFRAAKADVDFALIELTQVPDPTYNVYYSGWDRSGNAPAGGVGIHHPNADEKSISFSYNPLTTISSCIGVGFNTHWQVYWSIGVTEPGSSGSGIWDPASHLLVGTLSGGASDCSTPDEQDCYGKFSVAWASGGSASTRLSDWLDPQGTGATSVSGSNPTGSGTDTVPPKVTITSPTAGKQVSSSLLTVSGTASDNVAVAGVYYRLNGETWTAATTGNGWANWTAQVTLLPGANTVEAYAVDTSGNTSATASIGVTYEYIPVALLVLEATGPAKFTPNYSNAVLRVGRAYTTTVTPGTGYLFTRWVGTVLGQQVLTASTASLTFTMQSNLVLQAAIVPNPFLPVTGSYNGLFTEADRQQAGSGFFGLSLTAQGTYSTYLLIGGARTSFTGQFDINGNASKTITRTHASSLTVTMSLDLSGSSDRLTGTVTDGQWVADLAADREVFFARTYPATQYAGQYTLVIPGGSAGDTTVPEGAGYATINVTSGGIATLSGTLADGTNISQSVPLSKSGQMPLQAALYNGGGSILGWLAFDNSHTAASIQGALSWIKPPQRFTKLYPAGFTTNGIMAVGSRYVPPASASARAIGLTNGVVSLEGGDLTGAVTNLVLVAASGKVTDLSLTNKLKLNITAGNGVFSGSMTPSGTGRGIVFKGALLQNAGVGYGFFLGTNQSGLVYLGP
jgi:hypothetical protein